MSPGTSRECRGTEKHEISSRQAAHSLYIYATLTLLLGSMACSSRSLICCGDGPGAAVIASLGEEEPRAQQSGGERRPHRPPLLPPSLSFSLAGLAAGQLEPHVPPGSSAPPVRGRKESTTAREELEGNSAARLVLDPPGPPLGSARLHRGDGGGGRAQLWAGASPAQCILGHARR